MEGGQSTHCLETKKQMEVSVWRPSMRQDKSTYRLDTRRKGWVEYSENRGRTKHPLPRDREEDGGLSMYNMEG